MHAGQVRRVAALDDVLELERRHRADQHADVRRACALGHGDAAANVQFMTVMATKMPFVGRG